MSKKRKPFVIESRFLPGWWFKDFKCFTTWGYWGRYRKERDRLTAITTLRQSHKNMEFRFVT